MALFIKNGEGVRGIFSTNKAAAAVLVVGAILYASTLNSDLGGFSGDSASYILLARSIAQGNGYSDINKPWLPAHTEYGPGLPVILCPIAWFDDDNWLAMKLVILAFALASMFMFWKLFPHETRGVRLWLMSALVLLPFHVRFMVEILSDMPFLFFSLFALVLAAKSRDGPDASFASWLVTGLMLALAFFFRQVALALAAGMFISIFFISSGGKGRAFLGLAAGFMLPVTAWYLRNYMVAGDLEAVHWDKVLAAKASNPLAGRIGIFGLLIRIKNGLVFYGLGSMNELFGLGSGSFARSISLAALALVMAGWLERLVKRRGAAEFYVPIYFIILLVWQSRLTRYLIPVFPFLYYYFYRGVKTALDYIFKDGEWSRGSVKVRRAGAVFGLIAALVLLSNICRVADVVKFQHTPVMIPDKAAGLMSRGDIEAMEILGPINVAHFFESYSWAGHSRERLLKRGFSYYHFFAMAEWIKNNLPSETVVICRKPRLLALLSGKYSVQFPPAPMPVMFFSEMDKIGADYVLADEVSPVLQRFVINLAGSQPGVMEEEITIGRSILYRVKRPGLKED